MRITNKKWMANAVCGLALASTGLVGALFSTTSQALPVPPADGYETLTYYNQANQIIGQRTIPANPCQGAVGTQSWGSSSTRFTWQTYLCPNQNQAANRLRR